MPRKNHPKSQAAAASRAPREDTNEATESSDDDIQADVVDVVSEDVDVSSVPRVAKKAQGQDTGLARYDALQAYMRDIQRYALLKPEEEHELAVRYTQHGDVQAAARLVTANLRLVVKIAYDYRRAYRNLLDLIQEGNIGLMQAVKKYDPYKGVKLSSYAAWWIRAYILRFILNNWRLVKLGTTQAQRKLFFNLKKEKARLSAMGIEPSVEQIAERLQVSEEDVIQMDRRLSGGDVSLDAPVGSTEGRQVARIDLLPARIGKIDDVLADTEVGVLLKQKIHEFGARLAGKEAVIFKDRLIAEDPRTLQELGTDFGVSRERVRQLEKRLQHKLKQFLRESLGDGILEA